MIQNWCGKLRKDSGFTLIELLTVIAIIGMLAAIAGPGLLKSLPNMRLKAAARDLYGNMQQARMGAVKTHHDWVITFDTTGNSYSIIDTGDGDFTTTGDNILVGAVVLTDYKSGVKYGHGSLVDGDSALKDTPRNFPDDNVSYTANRVNFNPLGTGKAGYVYLDNQDGTPFAVGTTSWGATRVVRWAGGSNWK